MTTEDCRSKMCSGPHRLIFGRCYCARPKGHVGLHYCADTIAAGYEDLCADLERAGLDVHPMIVQHFLTDRERAERRTSPIGSRGQA